MVAPDPGRTSWLAAMLERRSVQDVIEHSATHRLDSGTALTRRGLTVLGVSVLIGAGIFGYTAQSIGQRSGPSTALAFLVAAVACLSTALCYAEISSTVPVAGSAYTYVQTTFGGLAAWMIGWILVLEYAGGAAAVARSWGRYVLQVLPLLGVPVDPGWTDLLERVPAVFLIAVLTALLIRGGVATWMRWITVLALATGNAGTVFGTLGVFSAAAVVFFAFVGSTPSPPRPRSPASRSATCPAGSCPRWA